MNSNFVILKPFEYEIHCNCPKRHPIYFAEGDILTIEDEKRYVAGMGWYSLISINNRQSIFMFVEDIEHLYIKGTICAVFDLDLRMNYLCFKVDEALDKKDKEAFLLFSNQLKIVMDIRAGLIN